MYSSSPTSSNRVYGFPSFPMLFMSKHAPSSREQKWGVCKAHIIHEDLIGELLKTFLPCFDFVSFPRFWSSPGCRQLGWYAQLGRAPVHGAGAMAGDLARALPQCGGFQYKHVWRCPEGPAGSPIKRRPGKLWRCDGETQKRIPLQAAQPVPSVGFY